jgi:hypothetical protein
MKAPQPNRLNFVLTEEEHAIYQKRARQRWRSVATLSWLPTIIALLAILSISLFLTIAGVVDPSASQLALMFGVASYFLGKWLHHWENERAYAREVKRHLSSAESPRVSIAFEDALVRTEGQYDWRRFVEFEDRAGLIWLWLSVNQAAIIPARVFADSEQRAALLGLLNEKIGRDQP